MADKNKSGTHVMKIIELGLQDRVYEEMKKIDFSSEALSRKFASEGINITAQSIRKFINKTKEAQQELIQKDIKHANEIIKLTMDYEKAIKTILDEVTEVKNMAKEEKDMATYNQLVGRLLQGLELFAKLTGDIKPKGAVDIKIVYNEINSNIENEMKDVRKEMFDDIVDVDAVIEKSDAEEAEKIKMGD